ncbi:Uncharacterized protein PECH_000376 [Penicillium ucsense]|uniref:F-box domain-containing protein n=1 Tax=Penicillium ucsense TaxID=2839758 RepID=A0A8J8WHJ4_9EURO|nr:Uncharacterized protein PECM_008268 [Penicillium ucsense]KAF7733655.1 Uncharacterized protein PECH_000376 [Penicillium ucsense]
MAAYFSTPASLVNLPFDILYQISQYLNISEFVHLSRTCRAMYSCVRSELIAHRLVENDIAHSKEGHAALAGGLDYLRAVGHRFDIEEALATASPYAVSILAYAKDFVYQDGVLCYLAGHQLRILDVHRSAQQEHVLNLDDIVPRLTRPKANVSVLDDPGNLKILGFQQGVVVFTLTGLHEESLALVALDVTPKLTHRSWRLLLNEPIPASRRVVVRHSNKYLWYAVYLDDLGIYGTWLCCGYDLDTRAEFKFTLDQMVTSYLGRDIHFQIIDEHLYVVSTENMTYDDEQFSSYYYWACFAPRQEDRKWSGRVWRREHREGPIDDLWTALSIQRDTATGRPMIVECRREWSLGKDEGRRTIYTHPLPTVEELDLVDPEDRQDSNGSVASCRHSEDSFKGDDQDDFSIDVLAAKRLRRGEHHEHELGEEWNLRRGFIYAHTKHHAYDLASSTFIDLVNDQIPRGHGSQMQDRLRLRTVSRKRRLSHDGYGLEGEPGWTSGQDPPAKRPMKVHVSDERFVSRGVRMWPREDGPAQIHQLLTPAEEAGPVSVVSDDRSLIYSISSPGLPEHHRALVLISFDPSLRISSMKSLNCGQALKMASNKTGDSSFKEMLSYKTGQFSLVKVAHPMYEGIDRGFWLR